MSFLLHKSEISMKINVSLSRTSVNQLEVIRRAFEQPTPELITAILERGIQDEFDRRLAEIGALPALDVDQEDAA